jgi:lipopolysaccharide transport system permease protein/teichoic acid transport system permease protein
VTTTSAEHALDLPVELPAIPKRSLLRDARADVRDLLRYRHLLRYLVGSALRTENANTVFGFLWWILDPLLQCAVYVLFIGVILGRGGEDFPIFVLTALIVWELFSVATTDAVTTTVRKEESMRQVAFPKSVIPLARVLGAAVHFVASYIVVLVIAIPFGIYPSAYALLGLPVALVVLVFTLGLSFFLSAVNVFFRDTTKLMRYVFRMWFYLSPGLYAVSQVPASFRSVYELNPFATFFTTFRDAVMYHRVPDFGALAIVLGASLVILALGYLFFVRLEPWFAKLV